MRLHQLPSIITPKRGITNELQSTTTGTLDLVRVRNKFWVVH